MKKFLLLTTLLLVILGTGCTRSHTLTYHQWTPKQQINQTK